MLIRSNPDVGNIGESIFRAFAFHQTVRAGNTVYFSGIAPLRGELETMEIVGAGDMRAQVQFCFDTLERCLAAEGLSFEHVAATTLYTTDMHGMIDCGDIFQKAFGDRGPSATAVQITGLFHPEQMFEVTAIAVAP